MPFDADSAHQKRRCAQRIDGQTRIRLTVEPGEFEGRTENLSQHDVLFFTDESMRVTVEIEDDGVVKSTPGRLVRLESDPDGQTGWAVRFGA